MDNVFLIMFILTTDNKIQIEPYLLAIPEFKTIWDSDRSKDKEKALNLFKYIFFIADFKSPYKLSIIDEKELIDVVKKDYMSSSWKEPGAVNKAIIKYKSLQYTSNLRVFDSATNALSQISSFLNNFKLEIPEEGKSLSMESIISYGNASKVAMDLISKVPEVSTKLSSARKLVEKEIENSGEIRGKGSIQRRELPKNKRK